MQLKIHMLPAILFCVGFTFITIANFIFYEILGEVNGRRKQDEQISIVFVNLRSFEVMRLHKELYPVSRKRLAMYVCGFSGFAFGLVFAAYFLGSR